MGDYEEKLERERGWHRHDAVQEGHFLNSRLFYSSGRHAVTAHRSRMRFVGRIHQGMEEAGLKNPWVLVAPTGAGNDLPYLLPLSQRIAGIDISAAALEAIKETSIEKHVGDIKHMGMFEDGRFGVVIMSQFFHHFLDFGFDEFLIEARRILAPGGLFFSFEPSILHPLAAAAWCGKKLAGNFKGCVEDESPFSPGRLTKAMKRCGFADVAFSATSYAHHCTPAPIARMLDLVSRPLLNTPVLKHFGYYCVFSGRNPCPTGRGA